MTEKNVGNNFTKKNITKDQILIYCSVASFLLLLLFGFLQTYKAEFLKLPVHWLAIAILPILFALIKGEYITRFKGLGIEIETTLKAPVTSLNLTTLDTVGKAQGSEKESISYLKSLPNEKKLETKWLRFQSGKRGFYTSHGITFYLEHLPNIQYFEIRSLSGEIICFIPISVFRDDSQIPQETTGGNIIKSNSLEKFIQAIENNNVSDAFRHSTITLKIRSDKGLVDALKEMRKEKVNFAAIVTSSGNYLGVAFSYEIERKIADSVLATSKT